mmetsp:Transcript_15772/g.23089  ORF Transcript_15772/g.23089 Transcript_15772/m.23089 type:complete len:226 (-) Transcript_15772:374-1051(-)
MLCLCVACATSVTPDDPSTVPKNDASRNNVSSPARLSDGAKQAVLRNGPQRIRNPYASPSSHKTPLSRLALTGTATKSSSIDARKGGTIRSAFHGTPTPKSQMPKSLYISMGEGGNSSQKLSHQYNVPIVVVNQVTASFSSSSSNFSLQKLHMSCSMERMMPLLGLSWSNCVNTRFLLTRNETTENYGKSSSIIRFVRHAHVLLSSQMPFGTVEFIINAGGGIIV